MYRLQMKTHREKRAGSSRKRARAR
jgi:hypothetical protein